MTPLVAAAGCAQAEAQTTTTSPQGAATVSPAASAAPAALTLRAVTYNVMTSRKAAINGMPEGALADLVWENRIDTVATKMLRGDPDIIAVQENEGLPASGEKQVTGLLRLSPGYAVAPTSDPADTLQILFRASAFTPTDGGMFRLNTQGLNGAPKDRFCVWLRLTHRATQRSVLVFNVHLTSSGTVQRAEFRQHEWGALRNGLAMINPGLADPFLLMGDFNASSLETRPVYDAHLQAMRELGLVDVTQVARRNAGVVPDAHSMNQMGTRIGGEWQFGAVRRGGDHIDYICTGASSVVESVEVILDAGAGREIRDLTIDGATHPFFAEGPIGSDHNPVLAEITFPA